MNKSSLCCPEKRFEALSKETTYSIGLLSLTEQTAAKYLVTRLSGCCTFTEFDDFAE